jgi:flagellar motor switch protein FliM
MEKVLNQEEIDAMVRAARGTAGDDAQTDQRSIKPCTFRQSGQLAGEQVRAISGLLETFARNLTQSLGASLSVPFEAKLASVEQLAYGEFLERVPEVTYMVSFLVSPMNTAAAMQIDNSLVFPLIDILLGGTGQCQEMTREVSEIEEEIMEDVAENICRELTAVLAPLGTKLQLEGRKAGAQIQRFLAPPEKTLFVSFEMKLAEKQGMLNLVFPVAISNPLLRKLCSAVPSSETRVTTRSVLRLKEKMMECSFPASLELTSIELPIQELLALAAGEVCNFGIPARKPASFVIAGREVFEATPVRHTRQRAAQIGEPLLVSEEEKGP